MSGIILDTSVYISSLRQGSDFTLNFRSINAASETISLPLYLSAVVLEELYVGAADRTIKKLLLKLENDFAKINRLLVPNQSDWTACGQTLSAIGRRYGFDLVKRARMTNDTLIAMSAARNRLTIFTANAEDFKIISKFRPFNWQEI